MRLIDADALITQCGNWYIEEGTEEGFIGTLMQLIDLMPTIEPEYSMDEWCTDCTEYDQERHCCPRFNRVIRTTLDDAQPEIVRCKECRWGREVCGNIECFADSNIPPEYHGYEWFCPNGERI